MPFDRPEEKPPKFKINCTDCGRYLGDHEKQLIQQCVRCQQDTRREADIERFYNHYNL